MSKLSTEEYKILCKILKRPPSILEEGIVSSMWSEHCSYKSSRIWLKTLYTKNHCVIQGPGENAGVIDIGNKQVAIFKIESHNHPSFIEPYQGAATGVGGIMRDIFTMGARPIANLNVLCFGDFNHPNTQYYVNQVVAGIANYGNSVGVPTIGGETNYYHGYDNNILVNAMTVGITKKDQVFYSKASGIGNLVIYIGAKTGRDGIHGATMASSSLSHATNTNDQRPTVQAGDPFAEKRLLDACLELMKKKLIVAIQDMGAAGLTSSSIEMARKGQVGMELNLNAVPTREQNMTAYELMLSESQERMLLILQKDQLYEAQSIVHAHDLDFEIIGKITDSKHLVLYFDSQIVADIPIIPIIDNSPLYKRPYRTTKIPKPLYINNHSSDLQSNLIKLLNTPDCKSKKYIFEQYDYIIGGQTVHTPGIGASIINIKNRNKALAITVDSARFWCSNNPYLGARALVASSYRNLIAVGAQPLAITNNMNFGNPENPIIMGQFVDTIQGINESCQTLDYPVVSGNVSFYNETNGKNIPPTPVIGGVGLIKNSLHIYPYFQKKECYVLLIGKPQKDLGASLYAQYILNCTDGRPPTVDLVVEKNTGQYVLSCMKNNLITECRDVGHGGLLVTLASMVCYGNVGLIMEDEILNYNHSFFFAESQSCYIITCQEKDVSLITQKFTQQNILVTFLGITNGNSLQTKNKKLNLSKEQIRKIHFE